MRASRTPEVVRPDGIDQIGALEIVNREVAMGISWMGADDVALLLSCYGIAVAAQRVAGDLDAAIRAGHHLGYPLSVSLDPGMMHPRDFGVVRIIATDEPTLRTAYAQVASLLPDSPGVLLQPTPPPGMEMIVGAVQHDRFGPAVMVGAGGILANLIADRMVRLTPLSAEDADTMLRELRTAPVLDGYLVPQAARAAMCDLMVRVGALADDLPQVAEIELDPVVCGSEGAFVVDARIRVSPADPRPDPLLRQLM
jgi:acyl-CoA synthetase (NDP forming)